MNNIVLNINKAIHDQYFFVRKTEKMRKKIICRFDMSQNQSILIFSFLFRKPDRGGKGMMQIIGCT